MNRRYLVPLGGAMAFLAVAIVRADVPVNIEYTGVSPSDIVKLGSATPPDTQTVLVGAYNHAVAGVGAPPYLDGSSTSNPTHMFCLDLVSSPEDYLLANNQAGPHNPDGTATYMLTTVASAPRPYGGTVGGTPGVYGYPMGDVRAAWLGVLANTYWHEQSLDNLLTTNIVENYLNVSDPSATLHYAAMQLAIWEIIYESPDDGNDLTTDADEMPTGSERWSAASGDFLATNSYSGAIHDVVGEADRILNFIEAIVGQNNPANYVGTGHLGALTSDYYQDMLVRTNVEVPEPSGMLLAGLGLLGLLSRRKRRA